MRNFKRMLLVLVLAMALVLTAACQLPNQSNTIDQKAIKTTIQRTDAQLLSGFNGTETTTNNLKASDLVDVIIEVEGDSLTDKFLAQSEFSTLKDYALSDKGLEAIELMNEAQATVKAAIEARHIEAQFDETYTTLVNGFSATIKYGSIAAIEALDYVERVIVSEVYAAPDTVVEDIMASMDSYGIYNSSEYTGKGILVAIIDTGVDYKHEAFANDPAVEMLKKEDVEAVMGILYGATSGAKKYTLDNLYYSAKTPFQFDYANNDTTAIPDYMSVNYASGYHGTHVAGIAVGNGGEIVGAAPDAQLLALKVFSDGTSSTCKTADIVSALGDCAILGVDVVNMSLGSPAGFTYERSTDAQYINECYELMEKLGITICVSAGNSYSQSELNVNGAADPSNPDIGVVGSPSSYDASFTVASINSYEKNWFNVVGDSYQYRFWAAKDENSNFHEFTSLFITEGESKEYEIVMIPNAGEDADYEGLDVNGKVAVVQRGTTSFTDKVAVAAAHGAAICLIYNNVSNTALGAMVTDLKIPTATILMEDGQKLAALTAEGPVTLVFNINNNVVNMSEFSSWGCLSDLTLKPEITAPGGNIYSSLPQNYTSGKYGYLSGTSMAAPNFAGIMANMREYVKSEFPYLTNNEIRDLCYQLVMSTALKAIDDNQVAVSPRKQGAGVANLNAATNTKAYLSVTGIGRTKLELGDDKDRAGIYTLNFNLVNFGKEALSYDVDAIVMTESLVDGLIAMSGHVFTDREIKLSVKNGVLDGNTVTVEAGETAAIKMVITLTDDEKAYLEDNFVNGYYVEGFATLTAVEESSEDLSIPFLAFYGDWTDASAFDVPNTEGDPYIYNTTVYGNYYDNQYKMGAYQWSLPDGYERPATTTDKFALSQIEGSNNAIYAVYLTLLRNATEVHYILRDATTGYVYADYYALSVKKAYLSGSTIYIAQHGLGIDVRDYDLLNNQELEFVITAELDYEGENKLQSLVFPVVVDSEVPTLVDCALREEDGRTYIDMDVFDNSSLMYYNVCVLKDGKTTSLYGYSFPFPVYDFTKNQNNKYTHDITDVMDQLDGGQLVIELADGAYNTAAYVVNFDDEENNEADAMEYTSSDFISGENYYTTTNNVFSVDESAVINEATATEHKFTIVNGLLTAYEGPGGEVVIPDGVTEIAAQVFSYNKTITKITIPEGCAKIGNEAFLLCANLEEMVLPTNTEMTFGTKSLHGLISLTKINVEEAKILKFGTYAFSASPLTEITINGIEGKTVELGNYFMNVCVELKKITINADVGTIYGAFDICLKLEEVYFNGNVGDFKGMSNFYRCDNLSVLEFHGNVGNIGTNSVTLAVFCCNKLKKVEFHGDVAGITSVAFSHCPDLEEVIFHGNLGAYRHEFAFADCTKLTHFTVADDNEYLVEDTETGVVYNKDMTKMFVPSCWEYDGIFELPETVTTLDGAQFSHSTHRVTPASYGYSYSITESLISWSTAFGRVYYTQDRTKLTGVKLNSNITTLPLYCFYDNVNFKTLEGAENVKTASASYIFSNCKSLESFDFTKTAITSFGTYMFHGCTNLKEVILPANVTSIPNYTFYGCTSLTDIVLPAKVKTIGNYAFYNCSSLESIALPSTVTSVGNYGFYKCTSLAEINLDKVTSIGQYAFNKCSALTNVTIGAVKTISTYAFSDCTALEHATLSEGVQTIGTYAFANTAIREVVLPSTIVSFDVATSFKGCMNIEKFEIPENVTLWTTVDGVLYTKAMDKILIYPAAKAGSTFELPATVTTIGANAFYANGNLTKVTGNNVVTIESEAFMDSKIFEFVGTPVYIGSRAFENSELSFIDFADTEVIGNRAFYGVKYLGAADFESLVEMGYLAFAETTGLKQITLCDGIEYIGSRAFENSYVKFVTIGDVEYFDYAFAFGGCDIEELVLLDSCKAFVIEDGILMNSEKTVAFDYFGENSEIVICEGVVKIAANAFINATSISSVVLPSTLRVISDKAFYGCTALTEITFNSQEAPILECAYDESRTYGYANFVCYMEDIAYSMFEITINHPEHASYNNFIYASYFATNN